MISPLESTATGEYEQEIRGNAQETRDSISLISYTGCLGLSPVISAKIHSVNMPRSLKWRKIHKTRYFYARQQELL